MNLPDFEYDTKGRLISFNGDTSLKGLKQPLAYTQDHITELLKCKNDIIYFAENYMYIMNLDEGMIKPKIRDYQKEMLKAYQDNRKTIVLSSRQSGKTTTFTIFILWCILFKEDFNVAILANVHSMAIEIMNNLKTSYALLPKWLMQGVRVWNERRIKLENNCIVYAAATSKNAIRGRAVSLLILDETAFVGNKSWDNFYNAVYPTISSSKTAKIVMVSTANGRNHFYNFWNEAVSGANGYKPVRVDYWQVPGRDEKWKAETIKGFGGNRQAQLKFAQEFGNDFLGSSNTLIPTEILNTLKAETPLNLNNYLHNISPTYHNYIKIYNMPEKGHRYVLSVDSAKVTINHVGDAICIQILDVTSLPFIQVATVIIREGLSYLEVPKLVKELVDLYGDVYTFIENNEGAGQSIADTLIGDDYELENVYWEKEGYPGYRTTTKSKKLGCSNLALLMDKQRLILQDWDTINQLGSFVKTKETYAADDNYYDDAVMSLIGAIYFIQDKEFDGVEKFDFVNGFNKKPEAPRDEDLVVIMPFDETPAEEMDWNWMFNKRDVQSRDDDFIMPIFDDD